ncbi:hypothetical protein [Streptomyces oceani]|uniref:Uncharacterized protein n=1 Tax=Streptomyces oceani TaxID=1075402 RepID=A0A1E7JXI8_9ACTN|nr:hypothetical protein [Streptomyces oceani]OEU96398.1 hypothetical protein AN216_20610 [Streptomyces oceani]
MAGMWEWGLGALCLGVLLLLGGLVAAVIGNKVLEPPPSPYRVEFSASGAPCSEDSRDAESVVISRESGEQLWCSPYWGGPAASEEPPSGEFDPSEVDRITDLTRSLTPLGLSTADEREVKRLVDKISRENGYETGSESSPVRIFGFYAMAVGAGLTALGGLLAWMGL